MTAEELRKTLEAYCQLFKNRWWYPDEWNEQKKGLQQKLEAEGFEVYETNDRIGLFLKEKHGTDND